MTHSFFKMVMITAAIVFPTGILSAQTYNMPSEELEHEGTWLQWPHQFEYGVIYRNSLDDTWVAMTQALVTGEKVHIIAYNTTEQARITNLLTQAGVPMANVDFFVFESNDVWVRDNGPIFTKDNNGDLVIEDWGFNGWGGDYNFNHCDPIPSIMSAAIGMPLIDLNSVMINEGGAVEIDGNGVMMATRSSMLSQSNPPGIFSIRNPGMTQAQAEDIFTQYLGVTKFIWLDGYFSIYDVTDAHIDGFARFANGNTIVTMSNADLTYWGLSSGDIATLFDATDVNNNAYSFTILPLTQNDVTTAYGLDLGYKGSYVNYYVANNVVLVPHYNDPNDATANSIIQALYPTRTIVGIDCRNLYEYGGMVHCVTQQQPIAGISGIQEHGQGNRVRVYPNPFSNEASIVLDSPIINGQLFVYTSMGQQVRESQIVSGQQFGIYRNGLVNGTYLFKIETGNRTIRGSFVIVD